MVIVFWIILVVEHVRSRQAQTISSGCGVWVCKSVRASWYVKKRSGVNPWATMGEQRVIGERVYSFWILRSFTLMNIDLRKTNDEQKKCDAMFKTVLWKFKRFQISFQCVPNAFFIANRWKQLFVSQFIFSVTLPTLSSDNVRMKFTLQFMKQRTRL